MSDKTTEWDEEQPDFYSPDFIPARKSSDAQHVLHSPRRIYEYLSERVYGQEEYKKAISTFIYKALKGINSEKVILIAAESGTGKSYLISVLSEIVPNIVVADASSMTAAGYKGVNHVTTVLNKVDTSGGIPSFVVLDEFNRLLAKGLSGWSDTGLLAELLVLFDDKDVSVNAGTEEKPFWVNPKNIFFILLGSFSDITDQKKSRPIGFSTDIEATANTHRPQITKGQVLDRLSQWPELIGRISRIIVNQNLEESDYLKMLKNPKYSPAAKLEKELDISIKVAPKRMRQWSKDAYASGTGLRGLKNAILEIVDEELMKDADVKEINIR
ncbi:MAG: hypothetical protein E7298_00675 [Lachnospiraceae bacterium]|nr:hypothetical protein [Lachnospiraceae bacterium]